jgi:hypothetical protein
VIDTIAKIRKYFSGTSQYPLLVVSSSDEYREILSAFSDTPTIKVSAYCVGADKDPDTQELLNTVKLQTGTCLLLGLGDYLTARGGMAKNTLRPYKDLVLRDDCRIAILLCAHMYQVVKKIYDADPRARTRILLPQTTPPIPEVSSSNELVYGLKAYLDACERGTSVGSVTSSRNIGTVTVLNPENAYDALKHKFPQEFAKLSQGSGSPEHWGELLENLNKTKKNILQYLSDHNFASPEYIFLNYAKKKDHTAWTYFLYLKLNANSQNYLGLVASKAETMGSLLDTAKTAILDIDATDKRFKLFYEQRKTLLKGCADVDMADFIPKIHVRGVDRIAYLTDNTKVEKQAVIVALCEGAKDDSLSVSYPDLYLYLQDYQFEDDRFTTYFSLYKKAKLTNKIDDNFQRLVDNYAASRPYNLLPARSSLISGMDDGHTTLLFLDAFGVEYLGYVKGKCAELEMRLRAKIARANLPTRTLANRGFFDEWCGKKETPIKDLDEVKHHPERGYDYNNSPLPIHVAEELEIIKTALERAKTKLSTGECQKVAIASDHGASRLAILDPDIQIEAIGCEVKSSGRYCLGQELPSANNIVTETEGGYAVIADYSRFSGSRAASVETHGGATLEEVIVPLIELTLADSNIQVILEKNVIEIGYKTVPVLVLIITPDFDNITVSVKGKIYPAQKQEKNKFVVTMPELKKGKYTLNVFENQNKIASKEFTVKSKGFAERDIL